MDQAGPAEEALWNAGGFVEVELVEVQDFKLCAEFVAELFFGDYRRAGVVRLAGVAGQDQAVGAGSELPRYCRGVLLRCVAADGVVTAAIEEEAEAVSLVGQMEHVGD